MVDADFVEPMPEITASYEPGEVADVRMHDGGVLRLRKVAEGFDPTDRDRAYAYIAERMRVGEVVTGLLHVDESAPEMHAVSGTVETPLVDLPFEDLCPGSEALEALQESFR